MHLEPMGCHYDEFDTNPTPLKNCALVSDHVTEQYPLIPVEPH